MKGAKRVTVRRSAQEWRAIMSRYERSGQTRKQFCTSEDLAPSTFSLWRRKLRRSASESAADGAALFVELADSPPAPPNVLGRAAVDVSFLAGLPVDKFRYHLPPHRQHGRLADSGIRVSRRSLTNWAGRAIDLLEPVVSAQAAHILSGDIVAMDETSIKAGRIGPGKMRQAYFWPVYGQAGELVFHYAPNGQADSTPPAPSGRFRRSRSPQFRRPHVDGSRRHEAGCVRRRPAVG